MRLDTNLEVRHSHSTETGTLREFIDWLANDATKINRVNDFMQQKFPEYFWEDQENDVINEECTIRDVATELTHDDLEKLFDAHVIIL